MDSLNTQYHDYLWKSFINNFPNTFQFSDSCKNKRMDSKAKIINISYLTSKYNETSLNRTSLGPSLMFGINWCLVHTG